MKVNNLGENLNFFFFFNYLLSELTVLIFIS